MHRYWQIFSNPRFDRPNTPNFRGSLASLAGEERWYLYCWTVTGMVQLRFTATPIRSNFCCGTEILGISL